MANTLTMAETAEAVGLSYERFRKVWQAMNAEEGFPAPVIAKVWLGAAVEAWLVARSQRVIALGSPRRKRGALAEAPAIDPSQARRARRSLDAARAG